MNRLRRYWFRFLSLPPHNPLQLGCGVTAYDDAMTLLKERIFSSEAVPAIASVVEDIDVSTLDPGHVLPNIGLVTVRGIWFPLGYFEHE